MLLILFQPDWEAPGAAQRVRSGLSDSSQDLTYTLSAKDLCLSWFGDCLLVLLFFFFFFLQRKQMLSRFSLMKMMM